MVKLFRLHKILGLGAGALLFILAVTGFFLDHDKWQFLYSIEIPYTSDALSKHEKSLFEGYYIDPKNRKHRIVCGKRGIFETFDDGKSFVKVFEKMCLGIRSSDSILYAATNDGIYTLEKDAWRSFALSGKYVNAISVNEKSVFASVDRHRLYVIDTATGKRLLDTVVSLEENETGMPIRLSRFVRDLHYGRGYFDGNLSLLINDYGTVILTLFVLSGYIIWWRIRQKTGGKGTVKLIKVHSNLFTLMAIPPLVVLAVTGIFLDHSKALSGFMRSLEIPSFLLPPAYNKLTYDIWSVDHGAGEYRIGNRYGAYFSKDLVNWRLENPGFAYRMFRKGEKLYISGMGAPNRIMREGKWKILSNTPHMFKSLIQRDGKIEYFSTHRPDVALPHFKNITLYTLLMSLHDGTFFSDWWVWVNDMAAIALLLLLATGTARWQLKKRKKSVKSVPVRQKSAPVRRTFQ